MDVVTPVGRINWCHVYDDTLSGILGRFHAGERGILLPGERRTTWHTFKWVVTLTVAGWVESSSIQLIGAEGSES